MYTVLDWLQRSIFQKHCSSCSTVPCVSKNGCSIHRLLNNYDGRQDRSQRQYPEMPELPGASHLDLKCTRPLQLLTLCHPTRLLLTGKYEQNNTSPRPTPPISLYEPFLAESTSLVKSIIVSMEVIKSLLSSVIGAFLLACWAWCTQNKTSRKTVPVKSPVGATLHLETDTWHNHFPPSGRTDTLSPPAHVPHTLTRVCNLCLFSWWFG